jgi:2-polyprenyl-3-methyl-5-hydroxy-6-metoxy-1,4-benzoquinol methylase
LTELVNVTVSREELQEILRREHFDYQRMPLPYGLSTQGIDRSSTARLIFEEDLQGASVLDIGCCNGFFCYEAKRRNAGRVVGIEINPERYRHAQIFRHIYGIDIELRNDDFFTVLAAESFDYVLFLNVVHHLGDPIEALRKISAGTRKRLVIEFPTFSDHWYRQAQKGVASLIPWFFNRIPLIGVGASTKGTRFVFSPQAIYRLLVIQTGLFRTVRLFPSPFRGRGRYIAICEK